MIFFGIHKGLTFFEWLSIDLGNLSIILHIDMYNQHFFLQRLNTSNFLTQTLIKEITFLNNIYSTIPDWFTRYIHIYNNSTEWK